MRFRSLGSGSSGNATLIETSDHTTRVTRVMVDCGFGLRDMESRLQAAGVEPAELDLIFITHEHGDHIGCALSFAKRHGTPLAMSQGTWRAIGDDVADMTPLLARDGQTMTVGGLQLFPFTVPHDAREPLQLRLSDGQRTLGVLTDTGCETPHVVANLQGCDALLIECNHDESMLMEGSYPPVLKQRVGGRHGHLGNRQAMDILAQCVHDSLCHVVAAHLSEQNNTPALAHAAMHAALQSKRVSACQVTIANQAFGTEWISLR
jgi:phosphoribosyl 1,2-cyclic phosphodiesterase